MIIPVVKRMGKQDFVIIELPKSDILFTFIESGIIKYQTSYGVFSHITTLEEMEQYLKGDGFQRVERGYLVQTDKIEYYDDDRARVFFGGEISAPVSRAHRKDVLGYKRPSVNTSPAGSQLQFNPSSG